MILDTLITGMVTFNCTPLPMCKASNPQDDNQLILLNDHIIPSNVSRLWKQMIPAVNHFAQCGTTEFGRDDFRNLELKHGNRHTFRLINLLVQLIIERLK